MPTLTSVASARSNDHRRFSNRRRPHARSTSERLRCALHDVSLGRSLWPWQISGLKPAALCNWNTVRRFKSCSAVQRAPNPVTMLFVVVILPLEPTTATQPASVRGITGRAGIFANSSRDAVRPNPSVINSGLTEQLCVAGIDQDQDVRAGPALCGRDGTERLPLGQRSTSLRSILPVEHLVVLTGVTVWASPEETFPRLPRRFTWRPTVIHSTNELRKQAVILSEDGWHQPGDTSGGTLVDGGAAIRGAGGRSARCGHPFPDDVIIAHGPSW